MMPYRVIEKTGERVWQLIAPTGQIVQEFPHSGAEGNYHRPSACYAHQAADYEREKLQAAFDLGAAEARREAGL